MMYDRRQSQFYLNIPKMNRNIWGASPLRLRSFLSLWPHPFLFFFPPTAFVRRLIRDSNEDFHNFTHLTKKCLSLLSHIRKEWFWSSPKSLDNPEMNSLAQGHTPIWDGNINCLPQILCFSSILFCELCKLKCFIKYRYIAASTQSRYIVNIIVWLQNILCFDKQR